VTVLVAAAPVLSATGRVPSPQALYKALLAAQLPQSELPAGFSSAEAKPKQTAGNPKRHHAVGEVEIDFNGGAGIVYVIFPTRADALANHGDGVRALKTQKGVTKVQSPVPGLPNPSVILNASLNGLGVTQVSFVADSVEINAQTLRPNAKSGDVKKTLSLARFAIQHLKTVEQHAAG